MTDLEQLAQRVDALTGPCRETDRENGVGIGNFRADTISFFAAALRARKDKQ